jgi:predicted cobalt transporter CbtA
MKKKLQMLTASLLVTFGLASAFAFVGVVPVSAQLDGPGCDEGGISGGLNCGSAAVDEEGANDEAGERVDSIIKTVINIFSIVVGVVSVIMIIIGGLKYITSGGDSGNVTGAKNTILYAIIGLVVVALAQIIVRFVLERAVAA